MSWIKADTKTEQIYFNFLERLRLSGITNMFGASAYLEQFWPGLKRTKAGSKYRRSVEIVSKWMKLHDDPSRQMKAPSKR